MKFLTRLTILLFLILLGLCTGAITVLQDAMERSAILCQKAVEDLVTDTNHRRAADRAGLAARGLSLMLKTRMDALNARTTALADFGVPSAALDPVALAMSSGLPEPDVKLTEMFGMTSRDIELLGVADSSGQVLVYHGQATKAGDATGIPVSTAPASLASPPHLTWFPELPDLMSAALAGNSRTGLFLVDDAGFRPPGAATGMIEGKGGALLTPFLVAVHPLKDGEAIGGALVCGQRADLEDLLSQWKQVMDVPDAYAAILYQGRRIAVSGKGEALGSVLDQKDRDAIMTDGVQEIQASGRIIFRSGGRGQDQGIGLVFEVSSPLTPESSTIKPAIEDHRGRVFRNALSVMAILSVVGLTIGILGFQQIIKPIRRLRKRAEAVSTGKKDASFKDLSGRDDAGELARSFERMRISIRKLMDHHVDTLDEESRTPPGKES